MEVEASLGGGGDGISMISRPARRLAGLGDWKLATVTELGYGKKGMRNGNGAAQRRDGLIVVRVRQS